MAQEEKLVIKQIGKPAKDDLNAIVTWFCESLDLGGEKDDLEPSMLREIVDRTIKGGGITSKELNSKLETPRTTVIYHLNRFIYSGLVVRKGRRYYLRSNDMESTLEELQADMMREFQRMMDMAQKLDNMFEEEMYARRRSRKKQ